MPQTQTSLLFFVFAFVWLLCFFFCQKVDHIPQWFKAHGFPGKKKINKTHLWDHTFLLQFFVKVLLVLKIHTLYTHTHTLSLPNRHCLVVPKNRTSKPKTTKFRGALNCYLYLNYYITTVRNEELKFNCYNKNKNSFFFARIIKIIFCVVSIFFFLNVKTFVHSLQIDKKSFFAGRERERQRTIKCLILFLLFFEFFF